MRTPVDFVKGLHEAPLRLNRPTPPSTAAPPLSPPSYSRGGVGRVRALLPVPHSAYEFVKFGVEYFFAGTRGPSFQKTFTGPKDENYLIHNQLTAQAAVWSVCGADVNLRTNSNIRVTTKNGKQAMATVDSEDVSAAIVYQLQWKKC